MTPTHCEYNWELAQNLIISYTTLLLPSLVASRAIQAVLNHSVPLQKRLPLRPVVKIIIRAVTMLPLQSTLTVSPSHSKALYCPTTHQDNCVAATASPRPPLHRGFVLRSWPVHHHHFHRRQRPGLPRILSPWTSLALSPKLTLHTFGQKEEFSSTGLLIIFTPWMHLHFITTTSGALVANQWHPVIKLT